MIKNIFRTCKFTINKLLAPVGLEIQRIGTVIPDVSIYEERTRPSEPFYLNIGAGEFYHPYWHNLDNPNEYYANSQKKGIDIQYDLTSHMPLPFRDNSLKVVYTSHVIEHINDNDVDYIFQEVYRCLRPGGYFRITCPDIDLEWNAYNRSDSAFWKWPNAYGVYNSSIEQKFLDHFATALTKAHPYKNCKKYSDEEVRYIISNLPKEKALDFFISKLPKEIQNKYTGDHINWFNFMKIRKMLEKAKFNDIYESKYSQSICPLLRDTQLFDTTCPELSVYVECQK
jgi:predicted SAM-dependent methyltransferase